MKYNQFSRRYFLQGTGGILLALPFLPSLLPKASAAEIAIPKRFILAWNNNGYYMDMYWPGAAAANMFASDVYFSDLKTGTGDISKLMTAARFGALRNKINMLRGLDYIGSTDHNNTVASTGFFSSDSPAGPSIDMVLGDSTKVYSTPPLLKTLNLRPDYDAYNEGWSSISYRRSGTAVNMVTAIWNENTAFSKVFGKPAGTSSPTLLQARMNNRAKVVDLVLPDYTALVNSRKLASEDVQLLNNHMALLSDLQNRMKTTTPPVTSPACVSPTLTKSNSGTYDPWNMEAGYKNHIDIMVMAMLCGHTNIGTLMMMHNPFYDANYSHDPVSHNSDQLGDATLLAAKYKIDGFYADMVSYLVKKMDGIVEGNGKTMLDNSLVLWSGEMGNGKTHQQYSMPAMTFGGLQGAIKTGFYVDYRQRPFQSTFGWPMYEYNGRPWGQMLVTILQAMGLQPADYETAGSPGFGNYVPQSQNYDVNYNTIFGKYLDTATRRASLPVIT